MNINVHYIVIIQKNYFEGLKTYTCIINCTLDIDILFKIFRYY